MNIGASRYDLPHQVGIQNLCGKAFPYRISRENNPRRRCKETVLLNWEPTGGAEPPAFSFSVVQDARCREPTTTRCRV